MPFSLPDNIQQGIPQLELLPPPDKLDCTLDKKHFCLLTDDGSEITVKLADSLIKQGWQVIVLSFPQSIVTERLPLPEEVNRAILSDLTDEHLQQQLDNIMSNYGLIDAFIHLNPLKVTAIKAKAILKHIFLVAKHLKKSLNQTAKIGRSWFVTVTHLDGELGLGENTNFEPINGGFFGLTKTLNLEWQNVFCRAIDLSPNLDIETDIKSIIAELYDPNLLITEVGYTLDKRITIIDKVNQNA